MKIFSSRYFDYVIWAGLGVGLLYFMHARASGPEEGSTAAPFELDLAHGAGKFKLADQRGKPVVMEVFASWCGACKRATPGLAEAYREHGDKATFIAVSVDDRREDALAAKNGWGIPFDVAHDDGSVSRGYKVSRLPTVIVIGGDGIVRHVTTGGASPGEIGRWIGK
ncbi:MAG TPA: TlpA disulfide reductase family protein [Polyangiaceae bacterium]